MGQPLTKPIIDFASYIAERTFEFTGREWVFKAINDWLVDTGEPRFFLLTGHPGSGKTAIAARLAQLSQGELSPPPDLSSLRPNFLSAVHFCFARDRRWINPHTFTESLAMQLAARLPAYALALAEKGGDSKIRIEVVQNIENVRDGTVVGVAIERLDVSGVSAEDAFIRVIREPLEALRGSFDEQVIILVDALDEALPYVEKTGIVQLLTEAEHLPAEVRFIVTSRPDERVENKIWKTKRLFLSAGEFDERNQKDLSNYVEGRLRDDDMLASQAAELSREQRQELIAAVTTKTGGNFLYVKFLLDAMAGGRRSLRNVEGLPERLDSLYYESLDRVIELGAELEDKRWERDYQPLLGVLSVAQASLTSSQLQDFTGLAESAVWRNIGDLQQFIKSVKPKPDQEQKEETYQLYHQSVTDFLRSQFLTIDGTELRNRYYLPPEKWHSQIADYYWRFKDSSWQHCDEYGLNNLALHLLKGGATGHLYALSSEAWMQARYRGSRYTYNGFLADIDLALQALLAQQEIDLPTLVRLQMARQVVIQQVSSYTDAELQALVWLGRVGEALGHARLRAQKGERFRGLLCIYNTLREGGRADPEILIEAVELAQGIGQSDLRDNALKGSAAALVEAGRFDQAEKAARSIENTMSRIKALREVAEALAQAGDERADAVFQQAMRVARSIKGDYDRDRALAELAAALIQVGLYELAEDVANYIHQESSRSNTLRALAAALSNTGHTARAVMLLVPVKPLELLQALSEMAPSFERVKPGLSRALLSEAIGVAGWLDPSLRKIHESMCSG